MGIVALKRLRLDEDVSDGVPAHVIREVSLLRDFEHPNNLEERYMNLEVIGTGFYSTVYRARDAKSDAIVALKPAGVAKHVKCCSVGHMRAAMTEIRTAV